MENKYTPDKFGIYVIFLYIYEFLQTAMVHLISHFNHPLESIS